MLNANFVYIGIIINAIGSLGYLLATIRGKIKPNKISFFLWSISSFIAFFAEIKQGVGIQSLMTLSISLFPVCILVASFINKQASWQITKTDILYGTCSLIGLLFWFITKIGNIAILFSILASILSYLPTILKAYRFPSTESALPWLAASLQGLCTVLTITHWNFATAAFPIYFFIINLFPFVFAQFPFTRPRQHEEVASFDTDIA